MVSQCQKSYYEKEKEVKATMPVFVSVEQHSQLLELESETGIQLRWILEKFIKHVIKNTIVKEEEI